MAISETKKKRTLKFTDFDEMMADVRGLMDQGYVSYGNWTLGQVCSHVADWMRFPLDGFPRAPLPIRAMMWVMKKTVGPGMKRKILADGFKSGMPTAPETVAKPDEMTDQQGAEKLQETIGRLMSYEGELKPSPLFGPMDKETLINVSLLHAEHHLGFLEPK
jgi:hypothetical protein